MATSALILGYTTTSTREEATALAKGLLEKKLIACANIIPNGESLYLWEDQVESSQETFMIIKSLPEFQSQIINFVQEHHSYQCPAIFFIETERVSPSFLNWVHQSLSQI